MYEDKLLKPNQIVCECVVCVCVCVGGSLKLVDSCKDLLVSTLTSILFYIYSLYTVYAVSLFPMLARWTNFYTETVNLSILHPFFIFSPLPLFSSYWNAWPQGLQVTGPAPSVLALGLPTLPVLWFWLQLPWGWAVLEAALTNLNTPE